MGRSSLRYFGLILLTAARLATAAEPGDYYAAESPIPAAMPEDSSGGRTGDPAVYEIDDGNEYVADDSGSLGAEAEQASYFDTPGDFYEQAAAYQQDPYAGSVNQYQNGSCQENCDCMYCNRSRRLYGRAEYLQYWVRGSDTPPLVTVGPPGAAQADAGVLPDATIVVGDERFDAGRRVGGRYTIGYWLDQCETSAIEANFLHFEHTSEFFRVGDVNSDGSAIIGRPFVDVTGGLPGVNAATLVSFPNVVAGQVDVSSSSRILGSELNWRQAMRNDDVRFDFIAGYRFFRLDEGLKIGEVTRDLTGQFPADTRFFVDDSFATDNQFHGGQIGLNWERHYRRFSLDLLAKVGIGNMNQRVRINGSTVAVDPIGGTTVIPGGGLLALDSNIGDYERNRFSVIPEFGANLHYCIGKNCRLTAGYSFIYVTNVVRPGDQIDTRLDTNQFPPPVAPGVFPEFSFKETNVWLQGINLGIEARF